MTDKQTAPRKVRLRATGKQTYEGRTVVAGEEFDATEDEAADLCNHGFGGLGLAERVAQPEPAAKQHYRRRDLRADEG